MLAWLALVFRSLSSVVTFLPALRLEIKILVSLALSFHSLRLVVTPTNYSE